MGGSSTAANYRNLPLPKEKLLNDDEIFISLNAEDLFDVSGSSVSGSYESISSLEHD